MSTVETSPVIEQPLTPTIDEAHTAVANLGQAHRYNVVSNLWQGHQDIGAGREGGTLYYSDERFAHGLQEELGVLKAAQDHYSPEEAPWLPTPSRVVRQVVDIAESFRRRLSSDVYAISDTVPAETKERKTAQRLSNPENQKAYMQRKRAQARTKLEGLHASVADSKLRDAERTDNHTGLIPLESQRIYHEITVTDVDSLVHEEASAFVQLAADILSPIRNEHRQLPGDVLQRVAELAMGRREELQQGVPDVLLLNSWRLAHQNGEPETARHIQELLGKDNPLRYFMENYEPQPVMEPDEQAKKANARRFMDEYAAAGGNPDVLASPESDTPKVRMRLKPEALWSIAMRDGGFIRAGDEGAVRERGRGTDGRYAYVREEVEKALYGEAADDSIASVPIVYGYYASNRAEQTPAMQSMTRIYGGVELVFNPDIAVDKRVVYGDSMNAVAVAARGEPADSELIQEVLEARVIPEAAAETLAEAISVLHGQEENTEFNPAANPYIECLLRGRITLRDCEEIRVSARTYDGNPQLMQTIQAEFNTKVTRVEEA